MFARRIGRPGLLGAAARTAVIAGTATATSNAINRRQAARARERADAEAYEQQQYAAPPPTPAENDLGEQLAKLGELHSQGVLSDAEFAAAKQRLLG